MNRLCFFFFSCYYRLFFFKRRRRRWLSLFIYVIIVYMMAQASFKLIYLIPNNMLRWMGSSVDGFGELAKDAPDSLISTIYGHSQVITNQISVGGQMALNQMRK